MALKELDAVPALRDDPSLKDFADIQSLAKSFIDTKAHVGASIRPVGPDASAEAKADFYKKLQTHAPHLVPLDDNDAAAQELVWARLGRPKEAKAYEYTLPEGVTVDLDGIRAVAMDTGMTKAQFKKAADRAVALAQKTAADTATDSTALKAEWGVAYPQKLAEAAEAAAKNGAPEAFVKLVREGQLPSGQLKIWASIAKSIGAEGTVIGKQDSSRGGAMTPAEALAQIDEIMRNPLFLDRNGGPARDRMLQKVVELQRFVSPA